MTEKTTTSEESPPGSTTVELPGGARLWLFRLLAIALPFALLLSVEGILRWAGAGYATDFLVRPPRLEGIDPRPEITRVSNRRFGWRFFPRHLARAPVPLALVEHDDGEAPLRIVVLGGSAAQGVPESAFGLARQIEAMLELRHPGQRFEVVNAAMTAVSSHVVLPIARDMAEHAPDLYVVYMGNNEVVGPFGAGSVFGRFSPRLSWIRGMLALRSSRLGQLVSDRIAGPLARLSGTTEPTRTARWRGMEMFLEQRLAADDPRLEDVARHFEHNLRDLVAIARRGGAGVVLSTVASNLRDQPPFAEPPTIGEEAAAAIDTLLEDVLAALAEIETGGHGEPTLDQLERRCSEMVTRFPESARAAHALGLLELARGRVARAAELLARSRDLDALRFRADHRIQRAIRRLAEEQGVALVDAEATFREGGPGIEGLAGRRYFFEHVHFTFEGNHALAGLMLPAIERSLGLGATPAQAPPALEDVAEHLAYGAFDHLAMERAMTALLERPPFTELPGHEAVLESHRRDVATLEAALVAEGEQAWRATETLYRRRLATGPGSGEGAEPWYRLDSRRRWAELLTEQGKLEEARDRWHQLVRTVPGVLAWHDALAAVLARLGRLDDALAELELAEALAPEAAGEIAINRGELLAAGGRVEEARQEYRRAARLRPFDAVPRYNLISLELEASDGSEASLERLVDRYRELVRDFPEFARGHHNLGVALSRLGRLEEAVVSLERAVLADPAMAEAYNSLGLALEGLGRREAAERAYRRALAIAPRRALAYFNLADLLLGSGRASEAVSFYEAGTALEPENLAARRNLALARELSMSEVVAKDE